VAMAHVMSGMPDVWRKVLAEHVPDQGGRCQACRDEGGFSASWPCLTRQIAEQAKRIHDDPQPEFPPLRSADWAAEPSPLRSVEPDPHSVEPHPLQPTEPSPVRHTGPVPLRPTERTPRPTGSRSSHSARPTPARSTGPVPLRPADWSPEPSPIRSTGRHAAP
jgi:hypothetical protein